jgi:hypothetical protein
MILTERNMVQIYASGYLRILVYDDSIESSNRPKRRNPKSAIIDIMVTKLLIVVNPSVGNKARMIEESCLPEAVGLIGIISLEDVLKILLQEEIYNELDMQQ